LQEKKHKKSYKDDVFRIRFFTRFLCGKRLDQVSRDMIARQGAADDRRAHLVADLPDDLPHLEPNLALKHLVPIFRRPDEILAMMVTGYRASLGLKPLFD
jgi:hypothetical protein